MKAWKNYSKEEKRMLIIIGVLLLAILLSFSRVSNGLKKGIDFFYSSPKEEVNKGVPSDQNSGDQEQSKEINNE